MSDKVKFVDYQESLSIEVGRHILSKGYTLASISGLASDILVRTDALGILYEDPESKPKKHLFGLVTRKPRRVFLGVIWLNNGPRDANAQSWIFEMYGREYADLAKKLAEEMALIFEVNITIRLVRDQPLTETRFSDYDF